MDLVDLRVMRQNVRRIAAFWNRITTPGEVSDVAPGATSLAFLWSAKEAAFKAASNAGRVDRGSFRPRDFVVQSLGFSTRVASLRITHASAGEYAVDVHRDEEIVAAVGREISWRGRLYFRVRAEGDESRHSAAARELALTLLAQRPGRVRLCAEAGGSHRLAVCDVTGHPVRGCHVSVSHDGRWVGAIAGWES